MGENVSMRNQLRALSERLQGNYWFIPLLMALAALLISSLSILLDQSIRDSSISLFGMDYSAGVDGARTLLSTLAGSMITVVGLVFSLVLVVLSLASTQYGPLVMNNFIRDRGNQFVMGLFLATFLYCIRVLQAIHDDSEVAFVPHLSILLATLLAVTSVTVLIYFIHHIAAGIRSYSVLASIHETLHDTIEEYCPPRAVDGAALAHPNPHLSDEPPPTDLERAAPLRSGSAGYIQLIDEDALVALAAEHHVLLELRYRVGMFVLPGSLLGRVYPPESSSEALQAAFEEAIYLGEMRTPQQDVELMMTQIVSIAVRALSPAVNDPFTAVACIDRLGETLVDLASRHLPPARRYDSTGTLRLITTPVTFESLLHLAFDQIRSYGAGDLTVILHLLRTIQSIGECLHDPTDESALERYAASIVQESRKVHPDDYAQQMIAARYQAAAQMLRE